jgi:hypothetical protein
MLINFFSVKNLFSIFILFYLITSCQLSNNLVCENLFLDQKEIYLKIPPGYSKYLIAANRPVGYRFIYQDSATIYVNLDEINPNISRISSLDDSLYYERFEKWDIGLFGEKAKDSIDIYGVDSATGLHFRDLNIDGIGYGYFNASLKRKVQFDKVIDSKLNPAD